MNDSKDLEAIAREIACLIISRFQIENCYGALRGGPVLIQSVTDSLIAFAAAREQAAYRQGLEDAAKIAEELKLLYGPSVARKIRALQSAAGNEKKAG